MRYENVEELEALLEARKYEHFLAERRHRFHWVAVRLRWALFGAVCAFVIRSIAVLWLP